MCHNLCDPTARWSLVIGLMGWITQVYQLGINYKPATFHGFICYFGKTCSQIYTFWHIPKRFLPSIQRKVTRTVIFKNPQKNPVVLVNGG